MNFSRRHFLHTAAVAPALAGLGMYASPSFAAATTGNSRIKFQLGMASFTFRNFTRAEAIAMTRRAGLDYICLNPRHLPMDSTDAECAAAAEECRQAGLTFYACGVVHMRRPEEVPNAFRYARAAGLRVIVAGPQNLELLPLIDEKVKETGIYVAIHNHVSGSGHLRTPATIMEAVGSLDRRIGICLDTGNAARAGDDVVRAIHQFKDRIYDVHLKDETEKTPAGRNVAFGRGVLDLPSHLKALIDVGYDRIASFEYEDNPADPLPGNMESVGYTRGILRMLGG